jgi:hypothetical protein
MFRVTSLVAVVSGVAAIASSFNGGPPEAQKHLTDVTQIATPNARPADAQRFAVPALDSTSARVSALNTRPAAPAPHSKIVLTSVQPGDADAKRALVREIQKELSRAACYRGPTDGAWSRATQTGMRRLVDAANARLPTNEPDYILLALAKASADAKCRDAETVVAAAGVARATTAAVTPAPRPKPARTVDQTARRQVTVKPDPAAARAERRKQQAEARERAARQEAAERANALRLAAERDAARERAVRLAARRHDAAARRAAAAAERRRARRRAVARQRVAAQRRLQPTYRLRARQSSRVRARRASSRRFDAKSFFARMRDR